MSIIELVNRFLNLFKKDRKVEVWDTSAISSHFYEFKVSVESGLTQVIVPEGVIHELSDGKKNFEICRIAHRYIAEAIYQKKIMEYTTPDEMRVWKVDEQVVAIARKHIKRGYNVTLVTCDKDMALHAKSQEMNVFVPNKIKAHETKPEEQIRLPCTLNFGKAEISVKGGVQVYSPNGKRKIPKNLLVLVEKTDKVVIKNSSYNIEKIIGTDMYLKRMDCG